MKLPLSSEQLELLTAYEKAGNLQRLSELQLRDVSVLSRQLQRLAEQAPVLEKHERRWKLTSLGQQVILEFKNFHKNISALLVPAPPPVSALEKIDNKSILVLINPQNIFANEQTEVILQIKILLDFWRSRRFPVIYVKHTSEKSTSPFFSQNSSADIIQDLGPLSNETIFDKQKSSILTSPRLFQYLNDFSPSKLVLTGFTGNDCIEASARALVEHEWSTLVISDASASSELAGIDGKTHSAERVHALTMANINANSAPVLTVRQLLDLQNEQVR